MTAASRNVRDETKRDELPHGLTARCNGKRREEKGKGGAHGNEGRKSCELRADSGISPDIRGTIALLDPVAD